MRAFLVFVLGVVVGALVLAFVQVFLVPAPVIPAGSTGQGDLTILFRNDFLTRELQAAADQLNSPIPLQGLTVTTNTTDNVIIRGTATLPRLNRQVPITITVQPIVVQNRVAVQLVKADVGTLTIPGQFLHALEDPLNQQLQRALNNQAYRILRVTTTTDGVVVDVSVEGAITP